MLRALVEKVEAHLQKKLRIRSLHAMPHRAMGIERSGAQDGSREVQGVGAYTVSFHPKPESSRSAEQRMEREREQYATTRPHRTVSPAALETPIDRYRLSHPSMRHDDDFARREYQERAARMAMEVDSDDAVYYDRWGRSVYRQGPDVETGEFGHGSGGDVDGDVADHPVHSQAPHSQASRSAHRRRWQYVDESEWREPPRGFVHVSAPGELPVPGPDRRIVPPIQRRYMTYRHNDEHGEYEFEEGHRVHFASRADPRAPPFPAEERYSDFDTEDLLEREEDLLAAQEYAIASRAQSTAYAARRSGMRHPGYYREASPPRYIEQRTVRSGSISRYPHRYFDDQDGEWLTDEDEHGVVYRRYPRHPAMPYPRMHMGGVHGSNTSRQRSSSFPSPGRHSRPVPPDSPVGGGMLKRRKTSGMSYDGEYARTDHARAEVPTPMPPFATTRLTAAQEESAVHHAHVYRDESIIAVASIEVPLSDESSPSSSPGVGRGGSSLVYERESHADPIDTRAANEAAPQHNDDTEEAAADKRGEYADEPMEECDQAGDKSDQLQDVAVVVDIVANAVSTENASDTTDVTSHDAIGEELNSEGLASSGHSSANTSDHDHVGDAVMLTEPEPSISIAAEDASATARDAEVATAELAPDPVADVVPRRSNWRIRANESLITALRRDTTVESERLETQSEAASQRAKCLALEERSKLLAQLEELVSVVYDLQCRVVSSNCPLDISARREMLDVLDNAMQASARPEKTTAEKLALVREGLENALSRCDLESLVPATPSPHAEEPPAEAEQAAPQLRPRSPVAATDDNPAFEGNHWNTHDNGWFEDSDDNHFGTELLDHKDTADATATAVEKEATPADKNSPKHGESLVLKKKEESALAPSAASSYASNLFIEVASCSPSSFVMKGMQKRLFGEIERANAYYYLHPVKPFEANRVRPQTLCDFGCGGGSAPAWVQKVISQITSRMKWFDEITYSLARARSGGVDASSDRLNRKKMNSTIRKLHLMAIQLHCVVSHLYCLRGRSECKENDSLPAALNSSYFEKRMIAYKSRLKLDADLHGTPDELLRDTFEFFPEFLFCIEMWGYDYREGIESSNSASKLRVSSKALPLSFFERVEPSVFDYESDRNGLLQTVCEELLTIVCLWNDFVWGDNLKTLPVERIASFESDIKKSTAKILQAYAFHLMGAWAIRLMDNPDELRGLRFTQQNAYYAESTKMRGFTSSTIPKIKVTSTSSDKSDKGDDDERSIANSYWQHKTEVGVLEVPDQNFRVHSPSPLSVEAIEKWSKETVADHLVKWSRVFQMRCELETCGIVVSNLLQSSNQGRASGDRNKVDASELLQLFEQAQVVGTDAAGICEMMALHFASFQLRQEPRPVTAGVSVPEAVPEDVTATTSTSSSSSAAAEEASKEMPAAADEGASSSSADGLDQQDVKDLIQILASIRKEIEEIFCARTRSGRMRDKLQSQSVQLAQQTIDLLQTIAARRT